MRTIILVLAVMMALAGCESEVTDANPTSPAAGLMPSPSHLLPTPTLAPGVSSLAAPPTPEITPSPPPLPSATLPPTSTPSPEDRLEAGDRHLALENYDAAAQEYEQALATGEGLSQAQQAEALWALAQAYLGDGRYAEADATLARYVSLEDFAEDTTPGPGSLAPITSATDAKAAFFRAEVLAGVGECERAIQSYESFLEVYPEVEAYVLPLVGDCTLALGDEANAWLKYEAAADAPAHRLTEIELRLKLAERYMATGAYTDAAAEYEAIHDLATTENTRGEMTYRSASAELLVGNIEIAYQRFLRGVEEYPRAYESYLGLVELVDAGYEVDAFQRGLVDFYAGAYEPAIAAFNNYLSANPDDYRDDAHLYLAWSYEGLGNLEAALAQLNAYAEAGASEDVSPNAPAAGLERGKLLERAGRAEAAVEAFDSVASAYPASEAGAEAAWLAARLSEQNLDAAEATARYLRLVSGFPNHESPAEALYRAARLQWQTDSAAEAIGLWETLAQDYPESEFAAAALVWLLRVVPPPDNAPYIITATTTTGADYYSLRARELAEDESPFAGVEDLSFEADPIAERSEAEEWIAQTFSIDPEKVTSELTSTVTSDPRFVRGTVLWQIGMRDMAKRELEAIRVDYARDPLVTYQLALYFRDLGLYRSSILAADTLLLLASENVLAAPRLIGRLSYPVYFADLVLTLAEDYGYDPLLQFALIRQESLYESFIASPVGAQGLSQVMPATGDYIAQRLAWPDYDTGDLYRPYVGLAFGAYYLAEQLDTFDGNVYAALSAYNAGPGNAARWHAAAGDDPDAYLEVVDFPETRSYIRRIYTGYAAYRHLYGAEPTAAEPR